MHDPRHEDLQTPMMDERSEIQESRRKSCALEASLWAEWAQHLRPGTKNEMWNRDSEQHRKHERTDYGYDTVT